MAHGRIRSFIGGIIAGIGLAIVGSVVVINGFDIRLCPPGYPQFTENSARKATIEWARLSPFPAEARSFTIVTEGGPFTRDFRVSFFGDPAAIATWVAGCPGVSDPKTTRTESEDGTVTFDIPPGGGAMFAKLIHHPARGTVSIRTYWS